MNTTATGTDALSAAFGALADPTRRAILSRLADEDATVSQLAGPFDISLPAISRHLKVLETAGLIERSVDAQWRRCSLVSSGLKPVADWIETYRQFWENQFDALDDYLKQAEPAREENSHESDSGEDHE